MLRFPRVITPHSWPAVGCRWKKPVGALLRRDMSMDRDNSGRFKNWMVSAGSWVRRKLGGGIKWGALGALLIGGSTVVYNVGYIKQLGRRSRLEVAADLFKDRTEPYEKKSEPWEPWIKRDDIPLFNYFDAEKFRKNFKTVLVSGRRGVGKTCLVLKALSETKGVCHLPRPDDRAPKLNDSLKRMLTSLGLGNAPAQDFLDVLERMKAKGYTAPIVVVDIDGKWTTEEVNDVITFAKHYGYERNLAKFVLVFSTTVAPRYQNPASMEELRCEVLFLPQPNKDQLRSYALQSLQNMDLPECNLEDLTDRVVSNTNETFLSCKNLLKKIAAKPERETEIIEEYRNLLDTSNSAAVGDLFRALQVTGKQPAGLNTIKRLAEGNSISQEEFIDVFGKEKLQDALVNIAPHPIYLHPLELYIFVPSDRMRKALSKKVAAIEKKVEAERSFWSKLF